MEGVSTMQAASHVSGSAPHLHHVLGGTLRADVSLEQRYNSLKCYLPEGLALKIERGDILSSEELEIPNIKLILQLYTRIQQLGK